MRFFAPFVILITLLGLGVYAYLGGLKTPTVALETPAAPVLLAGQPYHGPADAPAFGDLFRQAQQAQAGGGLPGRLANLYRNNPDKARDTVQAFVGIAVADSSRPLPPGWHYRAVTAGGRVVAARLRGVSYLLAPGKLYPAALEQAKALKLTQRDFYLEQFGEEDAELWVGVK